MESAAHLMSAELIDVELYAKGIDLLERTASITPTVSFPIPSAATITGRITPTPTTTITATDWSPTYGELS